MLLDGGVSPQVTSTALSKSEIQRTMEIVRHVFPDQETMTFLQIPLVEEERVSLAANCGQPGPENLLLIVPRRADAVIGFAMIDEVMGRDQPITYMLALDTALVVRDLEIISYREPYGGEVAYESWQRQFHGKTPDDKLRPGREVRNISGATISARNVTNGVRRALCTLKMLKQRLPR